MKKRNRLILNLMYLLNILLMVAPFMIAWRGMYGAEHWEAVSTQTQMLMAILIFAMYVIFGRVYDAFFVSVGRIHEITYSQMLAALVTDAFGFIVLWLMMGSMPSVLWFVFVIPAQLVISLGWSLVAHKWYFRHYPAKRSVIVTSNDEEAHELMEMEGFEKKFSVMHILTTDELLENPERYLQDIEVLFLLHTPNAWAVMQLCAFKSITIYRTPLVSEIISSRAKAMTMFHMPMLRMDGYHPRMEYVLAKRAMDVVLSGLALLLVSPIMLAVAIAIKLDDGGPVFYKQERLTQGERPFFVLKFRSMSVNAESDGVARLSTGAADSRVTKVGRVIRKFRLDELPQLLNILSGDMSIVGPRPERPQLTEEYAKRLPEFKLRLLAKAGLTGYAQVYGKYNTTPEDKLRMDLLYILRPSIREDLRIMLATVKILFVPESTEGVAEGQTTAMKQGEPK